MFRAASEGCQWFHPMERTLPISNPELAQPFIEQLPLAPFWLSTEHFRSSPNRRHLVGNRYVSNGPSPREGGTGHNAHGRSGLRGCFGPIKSGVFLIRLLPDGGMVAPQGKMGFQRLKTLRRRQRRNDGDQRPANPLDGDRVSLFACCRRVRSPIKKPFFIYLQMVDGI